MTCIPFRDILTLSTSPESSYYVVYEFVMELLYGSQVAMISDILIRNFVITNNVILLVLDNLNKDLIL